MTTATVSDVSASSKDEKVEPVRTDRFGIQLPVGSVIVYISTAMNGSGRRELCAGRVIGFTKTMAKIVPIVGDKYGVKKTKSESEAYLTRPFSAISIASAEMQDMFREMNAEDVPSEWMHLVMN